MKLGLSLSGGGIRAMVFHLGVLSRLAETEYWNTLKHISTVSGGSLCIALVFEKAGKKWPTENEYLQQCLPEIADVLTGFDLERSYVRNCFLFPWQLVEGRAHVIGMLLRRRWGITSSISEMPTDPRWTINSSCYETGKNWRFSAKRMGDYITNYVMQPEFPLSDAVASSAAVPGLIGPLRFRSKNYRWQAYDNNQLKDVESLFGSYTLWDGGVYDNLGIEALYKSDSGLREDLDFCLVCDASKPLSVIGRKWIQNVPLPRSLTRLVNIPMDQVRSLRAREIFNYFKKNNSGGYLRAGESVSDICRNLGVPSPQAKTLSSEDVAKAALFPTRLRKLSVDEYRLLFQHGYEVCSAVLYGASRAAFVEHDTERYKWVSK